MRDQGKIANWEVDWVYSLSFRAAQLDSDMSTLSNAARGLGRNDFEKAIASAELGLVGIQSGTTKVTPRASEIRGSISSSPTGTLLTPSTPSAAESDKVKEKSMEPQVLAA